MLHSVGTCPHVGPTGALSSRCQESPCRASIPGKGYLCTPGTTRTCNLRIRSPLLYPVELRGQDTRIPIESRLVERVTGIEPA